MGRITYNFLVIILSISLVNLDKQQILDQKIVFFALLILMIIIQGARRKTIGLPFF